jgi:hypothetical protein
MLGVFAPANAITSVDELSDSNRNHWAFEALQDLVEKYDVIEGYPSRVFRGNKAPTRWEMAAALNALIKSVGRDLARLGAEKANKTDLAALARLQEEFKNELAALNARTTALEGRATAIEAKNAEQDNRLTLLEKTQLHGDMSFGGIADIGSNGTRRGDGPDGIRDGISAIGRLRLTLDVPVREDRDDSLIGEGTVHARLIAAFGRVSPLGAQGNNDGAFNTFTGYSRIAGDASGFNEGVSPSNLQNGVVTAAGNSLRANMYLENIFYKQHFKSGIPVLSQWAPSGVLPDDDNWKATGDLYLGLVPWRYLFDISPYRGNELTQFQNTAFVNTPGIAVNAVTPTLAYKWHHGLGKNFSADLTGAASSFDTGDLMNGFNISYEGRLNYNQSALGEFLKTGSVYAGGFHAWQNGNRRLLGFTGAPSRNRTLTPINLNQKDSLNALYLGWNQDWYKGIGTTLNYTLSQSGPTNLFLNSTQVATGANIARTSEFIAVGVRQAITGVLNIPMGAVLPGWRDKDALGIAYGVVDLQENGFRRGRFGSRDRAEQVVEVFYRLQLNDSISIIPSYQLLANRLGVDNNDVSHVIGLRTNYVF